VLRPASVVVARAGRGAGARGAACTSDLSAPRPPSGRARNDPTNVETIGRNSERATEQCGGRAPTVMLGRNSPEAAMTTRTGSAGPTPPRRAPRSQPRPAVTPSMPTSGCRLHRRGTCRRGQRRPDKASPDHPWRVTGMVCRASTRSRTWRCWRHLAVGCQCRSRRRAQRALTRASPPFCRTSAPNGRHHIGASTRAGRELP
jgi:hypothetical protein